MVEHQKKQLNLVFHALADATCRQLLQSIVEQPSTVVKLAEPFNVSLNAISKHLKVLEKAGLVKRSKKGREHYFTFNPEQLESANALILQLKQFWKERLDLLDDFFTKEKKK